MGYQVRLKNNNQCTNRESDPGQALGRRLCYHYTIGACFSPVYVHTYICNIHDILVPFTYIYIRNTYNTLLPTHLFCLNMLHCEFTLRPNTQYGANPLSFQIKETQKIKPILNFACTHNLTKT